MKKPIKYIDEKVNLIVASVSKKFSLSPDLVKSKFKKTEFVRARWICWYFIRKLGYSLPTIADFFNVDHTSVLYGINEVKKRFSKEIQEMDYELNSKEIRINDSLESRNPYPHKYKKWKEVYKLFGGKCFICGFSEAVMVHHIKPRAVGGGDEVTNLLVVCPNHHAMIHLGLVDIKSYTHPFSTEH